MLIRDKYLMLELEMAGDTNGYVHVAIPCGWKSNGMVWYGMV